MTFQSFEMMASGELRQAPCRRALGMGSEFTVFGQWFFYPKKDGKYDTVSVDGEFATRQIIKVSKPDVVLIDIEEFDARKQHGLLVENCRVAIEATRVVIDAEVGLYSVLPSSEYWNPVMYSRYRTNERHRMLCEDALTAQLNRDKRAAESLLPLVDYVCPQIYVQYPDKIGEWKWAAAWAVYSARLFGVPIRPIVWNVAQGTRDRLSQQQFTEVVQFAAGLPGVESLLVYTNGRDEYEPIGVAKAALEPQPSANQ